MARAPGRGLAPGAAVASQPPEIAQGIDALDLFAISCRVPVLGISSRAPSVCAGRYAGVYVCGLVCGLQPGWE
jgi:hypothetical protein